MDENPRYIAAVQAGSEFERSGKLKQAIRSLAKAKSLTCDEDELQHLGVWIRRLQKQVAPAAGKDET